LHARDAQVHGLKLRYEPQPHKNTLGYWTNPTDWADWTFIVEKPGNYSVNLLQACGAGSGGSRFELRAAEGRIEETVQETGAFTNFVRRAIGTIKLPAGTNTLSVKALSKPGTAVMDLREVTLEPAPAN
jgi:arylsulfatase A